eukprot:354346-Chlamydomonas_euryale.AAC.11
MKSVVCHCVELLPNCVMRTDLYGLDLKAALGLRDGVRSCPLPIDWVATPAVVMTPASPRGAAAAEAGCAGRL